MKHCIITPTKYINDPKIGGQSDFFLALSHLLDEGCSNEYAQEIRKFQATGKQVYLDNGLFENHTPEAPESLIKKAILLGADYVFAPDHLFDNEKTQTAFVEFSKMARELGYSGKLAYVVQAQDMLTYISGYKWAEKNPEVDLIGLSILSIPRSFGDEKNQSIMHNRRVAIQMLDIYLDPKKPAHMLGLGEGLQDLIDAQKYPWIISNDSCSAYMTGFYKKTYDPLTTEVPGGKIQEKVQFDYDGELSTFQKNVIEKNINFIKNIV